MFNGRACFLADPEWQAVYRERYTMCVPEYVHTMFEEFFACMATIPELLRDGWDYREAQKLNNGGQLTSEEMNSLVHRTQDLYSRMRKWGAETLMVWIPYPNETLS